MLWIKVRNIIRTNIVVKQSTIPLGNKWIDVKSNKINPCEWQCEKQTHFQTITKRRVDFF